MKGVAIYWNSSCSRGAAASAVAGLAHGSSQAQARLISEEAAGDEDKAIVCSKSDYSLYVQCTCIIFLKMCMCVSVCIQSCVIA